MLELTTIPPKKAVICHICNKKLAKIPTLKTPAKCGECGASYTKTSEDQYLLHPTPRLEAIKQFFKHQIGYVPKALEKPKTAENTEEGITLLLTNDYKVLEIDKESGLITLQTTNAVTKNPYSSKKPIPVFTETFHLSEIKHVEVLAEEALTKTQEKKLMNIVKKFENDGLMKKLNINRVKARKPKVLHPSPAFLNGLEKLRVEGKEPMMVYSFSLNLSLILSTIQAEKYTLIGQETAVEILWRQLEHLFNLLKKGKYDPSNFSACEARITKELSQDLRKTVWRETGENERIIAPWIGRTRARKVKAFEYIPGFTARARSCFDAAANYVNRLLRRFLRLENADAGFGWESKPLFFHKPRDNPGLAAHLDLEEIPKIPLKLELTKMFAEGKFTPEDFHTGYREFNLPYYTPKPKTMKILKTSVFRILNRNTVYNGEKFALKEAHIRHVKHLSNLILWQKFHTKTYTPLMFVPKVSKDETFEKKPPLKRLSRHIEFGLRIAKKVVSKQEEEYRSEKSLQIERVEKAVQRVLKEINKNLAMRSGGKITC